MRPTPQEIDGAIPSDAHEPPGHSPAAHIIGFPAIPAAQEGVLQDFASKFRVTHNAECQREDEPCVAVVEDLERGLVFPLHAAEELKIRGLVRACAR